MDRVAGSQLCQRPLVGTDDDTRDDEAPQARTVGADDHRGVAGDHDAADGIGAVVNVGRVQSSLAAVGAGPSWPRAEEAHTGAVCAMVDGPGGLEELGGAGFGEVLGGPVRARDDTQLPIVTDRREQMRDVHRGGRVVRLADFKGVARFQGPAAQPAKAPQQEGGPAAEHRWYIDAPCDGQEDAHPRCAAAADLQHSAGGNGRDDAGRHRSAVKGGVGDGTRQADE